MYFCGNFIPSLLGYKSTPAGQKLHVICSFHLESLAQSLTVDYTYLLNEECFLQSI